MKLTGSWYPTMNEVLVHWPLSIVHGHFLSKPVNAQWCGALCKSCTWETLETSQPHWGLAAVSRDLRQSGFPALLSSVTNHETIEVPVSDPNCSIQHRKLGRAGQGREATCFFTTFRFLKLYRRLADDRKSASDIVILVIYMHSQQPSYTHQ